MISVEEALALVLGLAPVLPAETLPLSRANGRFMAQPATARRDQPPFAVSSMDGYAVKAVEVERHTRQIPEILE